MSRKEASQEEQISTRIFRKPIIPLKHVFGESHTLIFTSIQLTEALLNVKQLLQRRKKNLTVVLPKLIKNLKKISTKQ